ncbi:hypothetical protein [Hamadaea tsunoensis]|uniref:hypothetical protein n=1 Tax=Hamadaea tsunoensis TaxID=53368 RepID=UPI000550857E|nr:hypothetical protein [Hamadaea tsunoensis]
MTIPTSTPIRAHLRFAVHYVEMVVAMFVGMFALGPVWTFALPGLADYPAAGAMVMATDMSAGMAAWMALRGHSWPRIAEMCAAMYAPFVLLLIPYALGVLSADGLMMGGHVLMFPAMLAAMIWRRGDYYHHGHRHA